VRHHPWPSTNSHQRLFEDLTARIRELDKQLGPLLELRANEVGDSDQ
jgi:hypothetical protein